MDRAVFLCSTRREGLTPEEGWAIDRLAFLDAKGAAEAFASENWSDLTFEGNAVYVLDCTTGVITAWAVDIDIIASATARPLDDG